MKNFNDSLELIGKKLMEAESVLLFPHVQMDGDALGSSVAVCKALRQAGKEAWILIEDSIPAYLSFLDQGYCTYDTELVKAPEICMCIDCAEIDRFVRRKEAFLAGKTTMCIDHHQTSKHFADYNYIDPSAGAAGEIIYQLLREMGAAVDQEMGEALFAAITTDTGNFQYSNTTRRTHQTMVELYDLGIDANKVSVEIYENIRLEKLLNQNKALSTLHIFAGGKAAMAFVTREMLRETGASMDETEGIVETLRSISGVEISAFLKEQESGSIKVSMRAKKYGNVAEISARFGGGGHIKAAGCTLEYTMEEACDLLRKEIENQLR